MVESTGGIHYKNRNIFGWGNGGGGVLNNLNENQPRPSSKTADAMPTMVRSRAFRRRSQVAQVASRRAIVAPQAGQLLVDGAFGSSGSIEGASSIARSPL